MLVARWFRFVIPGKGEGVSIHYYIFDSPYDHTPGVFFLCFSFYNIQARLYTGLLF